LFLYSILMLKSAKNTSLLFATALLFAGLLSLQSVATNSHKHVFSEDDKYYLPAAGWLRVFSLGYTELLADFIWIKSLVYFGHTRIKPREFIGKSHVVSYLNSAATLDPKFRNIYVNGSRLTLYQEGDATLKSTQAAISLLDLGFKEFPTDGAIAFELGMYHFYDLPRLISEDPNDPKVRHHKKLGLKYIRKCSLMAGAPPYAANFVATLLQDANVGDLLIEHLQTLLAKETDEKIRFQLIAKLKQEMGKAATRDIEMTERIVKQWKNDFYYVPYDFFLLIKDRVPIEEIIDPMLWSNRNWGLDEETLLQEEAALFDDGEDVSDEPTSSPVANDS
jgi:hypothetical protein